MKPYTNPFTYYLIFFLLLAMIPFLTTSDFILDIFIMTFLYAFLSLAWNIQAGFSGLISVGHAAYFGIGAYTTAILYLRTGTTPWIGLLLGAGIAVLFSVVIGFPTFRLRGHYYILATLAVAEILRTFFLFWDFTGKSGGLLYPIVPDSLWHFQFHTNRLLYFYVILGFMIIGIFIATIIRKSQLGLYLLAIRDDEKAAQSIRINTFKYKMIAAAVSAALTAVGGAFYSQFTLFLDPDTTMSIILSADIMLPSLIGGLGTIIGPMVGSFLLTPMAWILRWAFGGQVLHVILRGSLLMLIVALIPKGIVGTVTDYFIRPRLIKK